MLTPFRSPPALLLSLPPPLRPAGRKERYANTPKAGRKIYVEKEDFRAKKMARKAGGLIVFIVDASGREGGREKEGV